jgi:hypothetical protein
MVSISCDSPYARVIVRWKVREALMKPRTYAVWCQHQMADAPAMATWSARTWLQAFLQDVTGIPWLVTETALDLAEMPRHDARKPLESHERTTDDPLLLLPKWLVDLTQTDVSGATMVRFIDGATHETYTRDTFHFVPRAS